MHSELQFMSFPDSFIFFLSSVTYPKCLNFRVHNKIFGTVAHSM